MAKARRNAKTHPKPRGDEGPQDDFVPPDRQDQLRGQDTGTVEVIDVFGKAGTVETGVDDDATVDMNSAAEGDARSMASEGGDDVVLDESGRSDDAGRRRAQGGDRSARARPAGARGAGDQDDDDTAFSRRTRQRIARERAIVNRERALRETTQRELTEERAARVAQDERIARLERSQTEVAGNASVKELESKLATLKPQFVAALEAGESAKAADLNDQISDLKAKLEVVKYDLHQKQRAAEAAAARRTTAAATTTTTTDTTATVDEQRAAELSAQFWRQNRHWANRTANKEAAADVVLIDKEILAEVEAGDLEFDRYSDEHFEELAKRLHAEHPHLELQDLDGEPYNFDDEDDMNDTRGGNKGRQQNNGRQQQGGRQGNRGAAPVRNLGQGGRRQPNEVEMARRGQVVLDDEDRATMRTFKMDPNDPTAKKYFAKEKARSIISGTRQTGGNR